MMTEKKFGRIAVSAFAFVVCALAGSSTAWCAPNSPGSTTPDGIQGFCNTVGGTYFPPGGANGAYGCLWDDMVIICGGNKPGCTQGPISLTFPTGTFPAEGLLVVGTDALMKSQQEILDNQQKILKELDDISSKLDNLQLQ